MSKKTQPTQLQSHEQVLAELVNAHGNKKQLETQIESLKIKLEFAKTEVGRALEKVNQRIQVGKYPITTEDFQGVVEVIEKNVRDWGKVDITKVNPKWIRKRTTVELNKIELNKLPLNELLAEPGFEDVDVTQIRVNVKIV